MKKKSKKQQILELLKKGYHLSKYQMLEKIGLFNSGNAILMLRKEGWVIKTTMHVNKSTGDQFAVYNIPKDTIETTKLYKELFDDGQPF